jgi:two-component system, NtrC family, sensor kinase
MMRRRTHWLEIAGLAGMLSVVLAFLYIKTQSHGESGYYENVAMLRQLKQLDARWEVDVLKARVGVSMSYDSLVQPLPKLVQLQDTLHTHLGKKPAASSHFISAREALREAVAGKTRLIEDFKSHNSVLHNSLAFLPTAAADVHGAIGSAASMRTGLALETVAARVRDLLLDSLLYSQAASEDRASNIRVGLGRLAAARTSLPAQAVAPMDLFVLHVETVLREQSLVNELLSDIAVMSTATAIDDLDNLLSVEHRRIETQGQRYRHWLLAFAAALGALLVYAAFSLIRSHALIKRINHELVQANATLEQRVQERTHQLREAQVQLVGTARQAGMAEIANNVLHNVGNVLNSVNVSPGVIGAMVRSSKVQNMARAVQMLNEHAADPGPFLTQDDKGKLLPSYLARMAEALEAEQKGAVEEIAALMRSVDHIKDIVAAQQAHAGSSSVTEAVQVADLVDDALRMSASGLARHRVEVVKEVFEAPPLMLDRRRLLEILVNLIRNAKQAMADVLDRSRRLTLAVQVEAGDGGHRLRIHVKDEGVGIAAENLTRIFSHGFTTRADGHGFGLHSCILAAKEMGGTLIAHSEGHGQGATFTLDLPVSFAEAAQ